jgi:hypothetical protein
MPTRLHSAYCWWMQTEEQKEETKRRTANAGVRERL